MTLMNTHTSIVAILSLIGATCHGQPEEVECPCNVNPSAICTASYNDNNYNYLPRMNVHSMTTQLNDFLANTNTQPRPLGGICTPAGFEQDPYPIECDRGNNPQSGQYRQIIVGTEDEIVLKCDGGNNAGEFCSDDAFCGKTCVVDESISCNYYIDCPSQCELDGSFCSTDSDCNPPSNGACVGPGIDACATHTCNRFGTEYYGKHGLLRLRVNPASCSATHRYRNGCGGYGDYWDTYLVQFDENNPGPEYRACKRVIDQVCQYFGA